MGPYGLHYDAMCIVPRGVNVSLSHKRLVLWAPAEIIPERGGSKTTKKSKSFFGAAKVQAKIIFIFLRTL